MIEAAWQNFKAHVYPGLSEDTQQLRQLKACWFSGHVSALCLARKISEEAPDEDEGANMLQKLLKEAETFILTYADEEIERQKK